MFLFHLCTRGYKHEREETKKRKFQTKKEKKGFFTGMCVSKDKEKSFGKNYFGKPCAQDKVACGHVTWLKN